MPYELTPISRISFGHTKIKIEIIIIALKKNIIWDSPVPVNFSSLNYILFQQLVVADLGTGVYNMKLKVFKGLALLEQ